MRFAAAHADDLDDSKVVVDLVLVHVRSSEHYYWQACLQAIVTTLTLK